MDSGCPRVDFLPTVSELVLRVCGRRPNEQSFTGGEKFVNKSQLQQEKRNAVETLLSHRIGELFYLNIFYYFSVEP